MKSLTEIVNKLVDNLKEAEEKLLKHCSSPGFNPYDPESIKLVEEYNAAKKEYSIVIKEVYVESDVLKN